MFTCNALAIIALTMEIFFVFTLFFKKMFANSSNNSRKNDASVSVGGVENVSFNESSRKSTKEMRI
jgi:hypothetical protein